MIKVGIVGGTGYTGIELLRLLHNHTQAEVIVVSARKQNNKPVASVFQSFLASSKLVFSLPDSEVFDLCDVVFFASPHGVAMKQVGRFIDKNIKVVDLSADFRIKDAQKWSKYYNMQHSSQKLLVLAVYGLPEYNRNKIKNAKLIANPGCYPTVVQLALKPLLDNKLININNIIADCKSGVSGAGREANQQMLLCEAGESVKAYALTGHRHLPEIQQELSLMAGEQVGITFIPHLVPMIRGIYATIYVDLLYPDIDIIEVFNETYKNEQFIGILPAGSYPETRNVKGSNFCQIAIQKIAKDKLVVMAVIDNLVKGAAGQAIQNMNIMFGIPEDSALKQIGLLP